MRKIATCRLEILPTHFNSTPPCYKSRDKNWGHAWQNQYSPVQTLSPTMWLLSKKLLSGKIEEMLIGVTQGLTQVEASIFQFIKLNFVRRTPFEDMIDKISPKTKDFFIHIQLIAIFWWTQGTYTWAIGISALLFCRNVNNYTYRIRNKLNWLCEPFLGQRSNWWQYSKIDTVLGWVGWKVTLQCVFAYKLLACWTRMSEARRQRVDS